jgi:5'-3' exonuclease|tara:strand:- start:869 stop:1735 length:867 start_codon:yes stop_codon:yes gene_type:complete
MILIDFTQVVIGSLMVALNRGEDLDDDLVRHLILNNIRYYRTRFTEDYGEVVICCDSRHYWRKDYFPNYKANRKVDRKKSEYNWDLIFETLNTIRDEIRENFPYKVIEVYGAEADDVIALLCQHRGLEKNIIVSSDKDFIQLHNNIIEQYSPVTKKMVTHPTPKEYLVEHILKGDRSDGVPNILSPDDTFTENKRQKPMRKTVIKEVVEQMVAFDAEQLYMLAKCPRDTWIRNWQRNETLIDLTKIPVEIQNKILKEYDSVKTGDRSKLFGYFVEKKLSKLIQSIGDF